MERTEPSSTSRAVPRPWPSAWTAGVIQDMAPDGTVDLAPGYPDPGLLPLAAVRRAHATAVDRFGPAALSYGHNPGADPLRTLLAARASARDKTTCPVDGVIVTSGTSMALYLLATTQARPGDVVLLDEVCYDLGQKILTDCGLSLRRVPGDDVGMSAENLATAIDAVRREGRRPAFVYLNPTHQNPRGYTVPRFRRQALLDVATGRDVLLVEDDAYAELSFGDPPPVSLAGLAGYRNVVQLGSFAKTLGPGLRLGWIVTDPELASRLVAHGLFVSGGSLNHVTSLTVSVLIGDGTYDRHLGRLRAELRRRRDALVTVLRAGLGEQAACRRPDGGFFLWLRFPPGSDERALVNAAARVGVRVAAGSRFGPARQTHLRLSYSFNPTDVLAATAHTLSNAWRKP